MTELNNAINLADELCGRRITVDPATYIEKINEITRHLSHVPTHGKDSVRPATARCVDFELTPDGDFPVVPSTRFN